ncbi:MAG TPA: hypothetical protein DEH25_09155 [Chloroflexi bacterium]|nr:hypothetical protein [Chloroflexota bacterium]HBY09459.1 hypothetical protein [Chloroflexota bacterium]
MEFGKSFTYIFEEEDWIMKILLAAVIALIPFVGQLVVAGWGVEITKRAINKDSELLPGWSDFVNYLVKGLVLLLIGFVYMLPVILVQVCSNGFLIYGQNSGQDSLMTISSIVTACFGCLTFIYAVLAGFLMIAAIGKYADTGEIGAAFRFGEVFASVKAAPAAYFMVLLGGVIAGVIAFVGIVACVIGVFFTAAIANAIIANLEGQAYRESKLILEGRSDELHDVILGSL